MKKKKYSYRGIGSQPGYRGFVLVPKFKEWLTAVLMDHRDEELSVTIRIKPEKKKGVVIRFKNGKPYTPRPS